MPKKFSAINKKLIAIIYQTAYSAGKRNASAASGISYRVRVGMLPARKRC